MGKKIIDILRFLLISQEAVVGLLIYFMLSHFNNFTLFIANFLISDNTDLSSLAILFGIPSTLMLASFKLGDEILKPHKLLKGWKDYWMLKYRVIFCFIVSTISLVGSFICFYYASQISKADGIGVLLTLWAISSTSVLSLGWARIQLRELLQ